MALSIGTQAPDFTLPSTKGTFHLSRDMAGKPCVLYFYPKDFTPACTQEACSFRDHLADFEGLGVEVVGISRDSLKEHDRFRSEHNLSFHLLSDESGDVCAQYDALVPIIRLPKRVTYLLDANHRVAAVVNNMFNARAHIEEMVAHLKGA